MTTETHTFVNPNTQKWALAIGSTASFMIGLDALVVSTALPVFRQHFNVDVETLGWTMNAFTLAFAASILTGSTLGDKHGHRKVFMIGLVVFLASSLACAVAPSSGLLITARAIQGIGGGVAVPLSLAIITSVTPPAQRGRAIGIWGAFTGLAVAAGPLIGGVIVEYFNWQSIFWLNLPIGVIALVLTAVKLPNDSIRNSRTIDLVGLVLVVAGVFGIAEALIRGNQTSWESPTIIGGLLGGLVCSVVFMVWERRAKNPMMPTSLLANRGVSGGSVAGLALAAGLYGSAFLSAQYFQVFEHASSVGTGLRFLPQTGMALLVSPFVGRLADRIGERPLVAIGLASQGVGFFLLAWVAHQKYEYAGLVLPLLIAGLGPAFAYPTVTSAVMRAVRPQEAGVASGISNTFRQIGAVLGTAIGVAIFSTYGSFRDESSFISGYVPAIMGLGIISLVGCVFAVIMIPSFGPRQAVPQPISSNDPPS